MIHEGIQFHNVGELRSVPGQLGLRLQRVPENVRSGLNEAARMRMLQPDTCEIRFVSDGPCRVTLSSQDRTRLSVFHGLFDGRQRAIIGHQAQTVEIWFSERLMDLGPEYTWDMAFTPRVCRLIFGGPERKPVFFHRIQGTNIRAPEPAELP